MFKNSRTQEFCPVDLCSVTYPTPRTFLRALGKNNLACGQAHKLMSIVRHIQLQLDTVSRSWTVL